MKQKRYVSFLLAFILVFSQMTSVFAREIDSQSKADKNLKTYNEFIEKTNDKYKDDEKVDFVVTLKENKDELLSAMKSDYSQKKTKPFTKEASIDFRTAEKQAKLYKPQTTLNPRDEHGVESTVKYNLATQSLFEYALENKGYEFKVLNHIDYIFNAVGINTSYETAKEIAKLPYVASVDPSVEYTRVEPVSTEMHTSTDLIKSSDLNKTGYTGKGTIAAVLDTGFWYESGSGVRPEFKDDNLKVEDLKLKEEEATKLIQEINKNSKGGGNAFFINNKIPFAKDYYQKSDKDVTDIPNDGTSHGTHVSGTVVANGNPEEDPRQIRGVAPGAQILLMQVFNMVGGATGSTFLAEAINDSIKLKADTINMSLSLGRLGDTRTLNDNVLANAINKATDVGIVVAVAAGNYGSSAYPKLKVRSDDFDYGTVRDVASIENSFAVASFNNTKLHTNYIKIVADGTQEPAYLTDGFAFAANARGFNRQKEKELEVVDAEIGEAEDFEELKKKGISLNGKAVIMKRHPGTFYETKVKNAYNNGALLAIVYNYAGEELQSMEVGDYSDKMPSIFIGKSAGEKLIKTGSKVVVGRESIVIDNPNKGLMSDFSSWGASIDLGFKPEITAPGEAIYSINTQGEDEYISMNGTSMASPHIAGASLIIKQYLKENAKELAGNKDISYILKNIMMSTAKPVVEPLSKAEYSPRKQGAGLVDLKAATSTKVYAYEKKTMKSNVNLYQLEDNESFDIVLKNFGDKSASYDVSLVINTDLVDGNYITLRPKRISSEKIGTIAVRPSSTAEQKVTVKLSEEMQKDLIKEMPSGFWVEGFVYFKSKNPENPDLSIPFISLKTKDNVSVGSVGVIEPLIYDLDLESKNLNKFYNEKNNDEVGRYDSHDDDDIDKPIGLEVDGTLENLKARGDKIAISPNGDGVRDNIMPTLVLNRYTSRMFFGLEKDGQNLIELSTMSGSKLDQFKAIFSDYNLMMKINDKIEDGEYDLVTTAITNYSEAGVRKKSTDYADSEKYILRDKLIVDRNKPRVTDVNVTDNSAEIKFTDVYPDFKGSGVKLVEIVNEEKGNEIIKVEDNQEKVTIKFPDGKNASTTKIKIEDWAANKVEGTVEELKAKVGFKSINVAPVVLNSFWAARDFKYTITNKETGKEVEADKLTAGTYLVKVTGLADGLELEDKSEKVVVLEEEDISKTVTFAISRPQGADGRKGEVIVGYQAGLNGSEDIDPKNIEIKAVNSMGKVFTFSQNSRNPKEFIDYLNYGKNYEFEIKVNDPNYIAVPSKFKTKINNLNKVLGFQIYKKTDKPVETVDLKAKIVYDNSSASPIDSLFVQLYIDGKPAKDSSGWPITGTRLEVFANNEVTFHNLPKYNQDKKPINYSVKDFESRRSWDEGFVWNKDWELESIINADDNPYEFVIKYKLTKKAIDEGKAGKVEPKVDISVTKSWTGEGIDMQNLPEVYFQLMDGEKKVDGPKQLPKGENTVTWKGMPEKKNGRSIYYTVEEVNADGSPWEHTNFERGRVTNQGGNLNDKDYKFNFLVTNTFIKPSTNKVTIKDGIENGKVTVSPEKALNGIDSGTEVTISAEANEGYILEEVNATGADGFRELIKDNKFKMPRVDVVVDAKFRPLSDDATISEIKIKDNTAVYDKEKDKYILVVDKDVNIEEIKENEIEVKLNDPKANSKVTKSEENKADFVIEVTAENGDKKVYNLTVEKVVEPVKPVTHKVVFDGNGSNEEYEPVTVEDGKAVASPKEPTKAGHIFKGWYKGDERYNFTNPVTEDLTLKAVWKKVEEKPPVRPEKPIEDKDKVKDEKTNVILERLEGKTRIETAIEVSKENYASAETVILVNGHKEVDALAAASLASKEKAPILLITKDSIPAQVEKEITRLGAKKVILIGGIQCISDKVSSQIVLDVERIAGSDRYETAVKIAEKAGITDKLILANGINLVDALTSSSLAIKEGRSIILVEEKQIPKVAEKLVNEAKDVVIVGGPKSVDLGLDVERLAGENRYETAVKIAERSYKDSKVVALANGEAYVDALVFGPVTEKLEAPILLTNKNQIPKETKDYIEKAKIEKIILLGGENSISKDILQK